MTSATVLLAVYNGEEFLSEQINSLAHQTIDTVNVLASDDGSTDESLKMLEAARRSWTRGEFRVIQGPRLGYAENFQQLLLNSKLEDDVYAFCDQDDIWHMDKLEGAVLTLSNGDAPDVPQVVTTATTLVDEMGEPIGVSRAKNLSPNFRNAVAEVIATGNTMVMNKAAMELLIATAKHIGPVSHDHWTYIIVTGVGGVTHHSPQASVQYRQHRSNLYGTRPPSWRDHLWRVHKDQRLSRKMSSTLRLAAMSECSDLLSPRNRAILENYKRACESSTALARLHSLSRSGARRQSRKGQILMYFDCGLNLL